MSTDEARTEYARRNLLHASSVGADAGLRTAIARIGSRENPPKWLLKLLTQMSVKASGIAKELAAHRDEIYDAAWKDAF